MNLSFDKPIQNQTELKNKGDKDEKKYTFGDRACIIFQNVSTFKKMSTVRPIREYF